MSKLIYTEEELRKIMLDWYELISHDHHKDRDCRFGIYKHWQYGEEPYYYIDHYGYLFNEQKELEKQYKTYELAKNELATMILHMIEQYKKFQIENE